MLDSELQKLGWNSNDTQIYELLTKLASKENIGGMEDILVSIGVGRHKASKVVVKLRSMGLRSVRSPNLELESGEVFNKQHNALSTAEKGSIFTHNFTLIVQINGKIRERLEVTVGTSESDIRELVLNDPRVASLIGDSIVQKIIYVPGRLINIVVQNV